MLDRRVFLGSMLVPATAAMASGFRPTRASAMLEELAGFVAPPESIAKDEDYWARVQQAFMMERSIINLNNGGCSPSPSFVHEAFKRRLDDANRWPPPHVLWQTQHPQYETARERLAKHWGVDAEEIAITRNSSESLEICQFGLDLQRGDEVLTTDQDYPRMISTFRQRERREGVKMVQIKIPVPCESDDEIVKRFEEAITPRTRMILMCHIINLTGQILPVKRVVEMARKKNGGIPVIVDGAHALAHFDFKISDLGCDYYGVSLHKWLHAPIGTGLLYVRRDKIKGLWSLFGTNPELEDNIRKFEEIGTHPEANALGIAEALTFHEAIGDERKEARLRYLRDYWAKRLLATGKARLHTSLKPKFSCGIANVEIDGLDTLKLHGWLWEKKKILTVGIKHDDFTGLRVTPSTYTTLEDLDRFCDAVEWAIKNGIPA